MLFEVPMNWLNPDNLHVNDLNIRAFIYSGHPKSPEEKEPRPRARETAGAGGAALIFGGKWLVTRVAHPAGK